LRAFRVRAGLSQEALATRAGLGVATLKALAQGHRHRPHPRTRVALADALGLAVADRNAFIEGTHASADPGQLAAEREPAVPAARSAVDRPGLPVWLTSFVGRGTEVEALRALLEPAISEARLLTLLGPGGVGKTRLAAAVAELLTPAYADGVVFVDLAPLSNARLVAATLARALGLRVSSGRSARELLVEHLKPRQLLLVLDNFEHVVDAVPLLSEVLRECPRVALLTTSRTALRLQGERRFNLRPLSSPTLTWTADPARR
jgi:transcriptional regulator with XRE-family HTH domain